MIYNSAYQKVASVRAGNGYQADLHEFRLTPEGTAWIDMFDPIDLNLARCDGRSAGILTDSVIEEVDVKTGLVMWQWHALGHIPIGETHNAAPKSNYPWDYVHINSVDPGSSGDVLLSSRNTWALYDVDIDSGAVHWRLGGDQHRASGSVPARAPTGSTTRSCSRGADLGVRQRLGPAEGEAVARSAARPERGRAHGHARQQFVNPSRTLLARARATCSASWRRLAARLRGLPNFTEYDASGHVLLDGDARQERAELQDLLRPWNGQPTTAPAVVGGRARAGDAWR